MLVLAGEKLKSIQGQFMENGSELQHLDISSNFLKSGADLKPFAQTLQTLIIDNNYFYNLEDFPLLPQLLTFSANKNNFNNLEIFLEHVRNKFPSLIHLSLIKNPLCPMFIGEDEYQKYRTQVISFLPNLQNLDGTPVDPRESRTDYLEIKNGESKRQIKQGEEETKGTIEFNQKYSKPTSKTVKSRSEGNRFVKNNQL